MSAIRALAAALSAGLALDRAIAMTEIDADPHWATVGKVLQLARETGVPRHDALVALADSVDAAAERDSAVKIGAAAARQTSRILFALPVVTLVGAEAFGFPVLSFLIGSALGWGCLVVSIALCFGAWRWMARIRAAVPTPPTHTGLVLTLAAGIARTSALGADTMALLTALSTEWETGSEIAAIERSRSLSRDTGIPIAGLLTIESGGVRRQAVDRTRHAIELLPGKLLAPVGLCIFPAFILSPVIPVIAGMATAAFGR